MIALRALNSTFGAAASLRRGRRRSFTLVELLITIAIIAILAGSILFVMTGAQEQARQARARSQVTRIGEMLMRRWEEYRTRPVPVRIPPGAGGIQAARIRLNGLREIMRMEMPDRMTDVMDGKAALSPLLTVPSLNRAYKRRAKPSWTQQHESSECLYLILANIRDGDGVATDRFTSNEIGDTDGDGMPEIIDPWGNPIHFIRWPYLARTPMQTGNATVTPDPFDPFRAGVSNPQTDASNIALLPLVFSAGSDGVYGFLESDPSGTPFHYNSTPSPWPNNPYAAQDGSMTGNFAGSRPGFASPTLNPGNNDDIHNHIMN